MSGYDENELLLDLLGQDYDNFGEPTPLSNHPSVLKGFTLTFLILSWLSVCFRLFVRIRLVRSPGWDDWFVLLYLICGTIASSAFLLSINFGTGRHLLLLTVGQAGRFLVTFYLMNAFMNLAMTFIKLSLLFQYLRIFERGSWPHRVSIVTSVFVGIWGLTFGVLAFVPCSKISDFWYSPPDAHCWAYGSNVPRVFAGTFIAQCTMSLVFDLIILAIPIRLYWQPNVTTKMRAGLLALLLMGAVVNFISIWRLQTIVQHQAGWYPTHDPTWYGPISLLLAMLEIQVASVCASIPIFWPVLEPYLGRSLGNIFVTHEINVQVQHEDQYGDQNAIVPESLERKTSSRASRSRGSSYGSRGGHVRGESETELSPMDRITSHYKNEYVMGQVDPFREGRQAPKSVIKSENQRENRKWFQV